VKPYPAGFNISTEYKKSEAKLCTSNLTNEGKNGTAGDPTARMLIGDYYYFFIIGKYTISFMQGIYKYIPETNHAPMG
jgi:hypothetical protein